MRPTTAHLLRVALATAALVVGGRAVSADRGDERRADPCAEASFTDVRLPSWVAVDEIRVIVARNSPEQGAAKISVEAGQYDRVVRVQGAASRGLKFTSPLQGTRFHVALDPVFEAQRSACVERILLLRGGALVASTQP